MKLRRSRQTSAPDGGSVAAFLPDSVAVGARSLEVGSEHVASFAITGYPREVHPGWLQPLLTYPGRLDVSVHVDPVDPVTAADRLRKQLAKLESARRVTHEHGRLADPHVEVATEDAYDLSARVARGEGKLYRVGLYLTVHAATREALADEVAAVRALAASLLLNATPTTYRAVQGWVTCLPMGLDLIGMRRSFDTAALSAAFPFTSPDLRPPQATSAAAPTGVLYGLNLGSQGLVHHDRFALDNYNAVVLGRSGAGKSYLVKLELLRSLYRHVEVAVIDPEDEYARLAAAVGGRRISLGSDGVHLNPLDVPIYTRPDGRRTAPPDAVIRRSLFLHTVLDVLLAGDVTSGQRAVLDRAITATYQKAGITTDPRTWTRPAPLLGDLAAALTDIGDATGIELAQRLHPYTHGAFSGLFTAPTTTPPEGHLIVFSLRGCPDELKPIATLLVLDAIWRRVTHPVLRRPRLVVLDEAWTLMQQPAGARFVYRMAKTFRKHWAGLTVATQDTPDVLGTDLGKAVVTNAATQILLRQAPQAIDDVADVFNLSQGERQFLLTADKGQALLCLGNQHAAFESLASPTENALITTDPAELASRSNSDAEDSFVDLGTGEFTDDLDDHIELDAA
jgi:type IV secretory pathway VirB4 component